MHPRLLAAFFISLLSTFLFAMSEVSLDPIELGEEGLTIGEAITLLEEAKAQPINLETTAIAAGGTLAAGVVLDILGGIGVSYTCPDFGAFEAAAIVCGFSGAGVALGGICTIGACSGALSVYFYNKYLIEPRNESISALIAELVLLNPNEHLQGEKLSSFTTLVKGNWVLFTESLCRCNGEQLRAMTSTLEVRLE